MDAAVSSFFYGPISCHPGLKDVVNRQMPEVWQRLVVPLQPTGCLMSDLNAYLAVVVAALPALAERLAAGDHVTDYINSQLDQMEDETDFSDLSQLKPLSEKHNSLRFDIPTLQFRTMDC